MSLSVKIQFRAPKNLKEKIVDIARNKKVKPSELYRLALQEYISSYTTTPTIKELGRQVDRHETKLAQIEKALLKKGIMQ